MSAYLKFFELEQSPFEGTDQSKVVLGTQALREAFSTIQTGLDEGASRIFLNGGPGVGKTSFARAMPKLLGDETRVAGIADPSLSWESLRGGIAIQWGLGKPGLSRAGLLEAAEDHRLLLVIDQAERATEDFLDHLDVLLSYRDEFADPVVQSVLLGQLGGARAESAPPLMWWLDRIQTLQLEYAPLPREGVGPYIRKHLKRAGWRGGRLFTEDAALAIHGWTGGIPGDVSALCEHLLVEAAECGVELIDASFVDLYNEENEKPEAEEEPWNFDHAFDEFETAASTAEDLEAEITASLHEDTLSAADDALDSTDGLGAAIDAAIDANGDFDADFGDDFGADFGADLDAHLEAETHSEAAADIDASGLSHPGMERAPEDEAAESRREEEEEERIASQKTALPTRPKSAKREAPLPKLETTLEHFETIELMDEATATANSLGGGAGTDPLARGAVAEANYLDDEEGFDPNVEIDNETYAELEALENALSAPPSIAELREIRGSLFAQHAKPLTLGALAAVIGGLAFAFLFKAPTVDDGQGRMASTPSMLGRVNGPADGMPPEPAPVVPLQNNAQPESQSASPLPRTGSTSSSSNDLLARVGPRLKQASEQSSARRALAKSGKTQIQKQLEAEDREEVLEDLRPQGLKASTVDLSDNRNR